MSDSLGTLYSTTYSADGDMTDCNGYAITRIPNNLPSFFAPSVSYSTFSYGPDHARYYQVATFNGATTDTTYLGRLFAVVSTSTGTINLYGRQRQDRNMSCLIFRLDQRS